MTAAVSTITLVAYLLGSAAHHNVVPLHLTSTAFPDHGVIPVAYTCRGRNAMIPLVWEGHPLETRSYAVVMTDSDPGEKSWYNFELYNIPSDATQLNVKKFIPFRDEGFAANSRWHTHYDGPCPVSGVHHYAIKLYALDTRLHFARPASAPELLQAMHGHVLASAQLAARYP